MQSRAAPDEAAPTDDELRSLDGEFDATSSASGSRSAGSGRTDDLTDTGDSDDGDDSDDGVGDLDDVDEGALEDEDLEDEEGLEDEDVLDDDGIDGESLDEDVEEDQDEAAVARDGARRKSTPADGADADTDEDEDLADEVEASLDVILAERLRGGGTDADEELDDEEEGEEDDAPNQLATVIPVRRPDEFLCQSCFLLKPPGQLADRDHQLCRDCA